MMILRVLAQWVLKDISLCSNGNQNQKSAKLLGNSLNDQKS